MWLHYIAQSRTYSVLKTAQFVAIFCVRSCHFPLPPPRELYVHNESELLFLFFFFPLHVPCCRVESFWVILILALVVYNVTNATIFSAMSLLINNSVTKDKVGSVNGLALSATSLVRYICRPWMHCDCTYMCVVSLRCRCSNKCWGGWGP